MFTNENILYFLRYLKKHDGENENTLLAIITTHLSINKGTANQTFINYIIDQKGYVHRDKSKECYITPKGNRFIVKHDAIKITKIAITYFIVPVFVVMTFVFQFIWKPGFLTNQKAKSNQTEIKDSKSDTLLKADSLLLPTQNDTSGIDSLHLPTQDKRLSPKQSTTGK